MAGLALLRTEVVAYHAHQNFKQPGLDLRAPFELRQSAMGDDEYLLHDIVRVPGIDAEPARRPPDELQVLLVHGFEIGHRQAGLAPLRLRARLRAGSCAGKAGSCLS